MAELTFPHQVWQVGPKTYKVKSGNTGMIYTVRVLVTGETDCDCKRRNFSPVCSHGDAVLNYIRTNTPQSKPRKTLEEIYEALG